MAISNYTTSVPTEKTASEIQRLLAAAKASAIMSEFDTNGTLSAISFRIPSRHGLLTFRLPANVDAMLKALIQDGKLPYRLRTREQAAKVAWRVIKDWVEAQLALIRTGMADVNQVFLPYAQDGEGVTLYERIEQKGFTHLIGP